MNALYRLAALGFSLAVMTLSPACDVGGDPGEDPPDPVIVVDLSPTTAEIEIGDLLRLEATIVSVGGGFMRDDVTETWRSLNPDIVSVDQTGEARGLSAGVAVIVYKASVGDGMGVNATEVFAEVTVVAPQGGTLQDGVYGLDGLTSVEAISRLGACDGGTERFGDLSGECLVGVAGAEGVQVLDVGDPEPRQTLAAAVLGDLYGTIGLTDTPPGPNADASVFFFGSNGYGFSGGSGAFITPNRRVFDAHPAGNDPASGWATMVEPATGFRTIGPSSEPPGFAVQGPFVQRSLVSGEPVSAWMAGPGPNAPALLLTRGTTSFLYPDGPDGVGSPLELGLDARKVRCAEAGSGFLCGVSLFGADEVAVVIWDGKTTPTLAGTAAVGDGPVGIDVRRLPGGTFGIASTGFLDDTVTELEVSADGTVLRTVMDAAPSGCSQPGHVIYGGASSDLRLLGTCFGSGTYYVRASGL